MPYVKSKGTDIYYESHGSGPAIIFAHGAGGNAAIWYNQLAHFKETHRCIAFDHRSFARSPASDTSITIPSFRDDILAIMDQLEVNQAHLVGQSMGGYSVLRCALDAPERVNTLTLSCTPAGIPITNPTEAVQSLGSRGAEGIQATMSKKTFENPALVQLYAAIQSFNTEFSFDRLSALRHEEDQVKPEALRSLQVPTLFISGTEDPLFLPEQLSELVPLFQEARIEIVADAGHSPYFEQPSIFNRLLADHINKHS